MNILAGLFQALGMIGIFSLFICIPLGIIFLIIAARKQDEEKKKVFKKRGKWLILSPFIIIIGSLIITSILNAIIYAGK